MEMLGDTTLCLLTRRSLCSPDTARWLFSTLAETAPELLPEKYDSGEPIRRLFSIDALEEPVALWGQFPYQGFLWKRAKPRLLGQYYPASPSHPADVIQLTLKSGLVEQQKLVGLLHQWSARFTPIIAYLHRLCDKDLENREFYRDHVMPFNQGLVLHDLKKGLPGICWATVFGKEYTELFGQQRLATCPVHLARHLDGLFYLQLTGDIKSAENDYETFKLIRSGAVAHLNSHAFYGDDPPITLPSFLASG